ncbi:MULTISPECIES: hypothetical protein [unclassified Paraflavitalea]|uniref:hypothetical protein n=1 Tax=unclassified Paraflavitalea TaxID=2798305 RepID=UPI003D3307F2
MNSNVDEWMSDLFNRSGISKFIIGHEKATLKSRSCIGLMVGRQYSAMVSG